MIKIALITGLREDNFMTLRWNADIHTVQQKTGEYRILNNRGMYLGEIIKNSENYYKIIVNERDTNIFSYKYKEIEKIKEIAERIVNNQLESPEIKEKINFSPYIANYQKFRYAA